MVRTWFNMKKKYFFNLCSFTAPTSSSSRQLSFPSAQRQPSLEYCPSSLPTPGRSYEMPSGHRRALRDDDDCYPQGLYVNKAGKRKMLVSPAKEKRPRREPPTLEVCCKNHFKIN